MFTYNSYTFYISFSSRWYSSASAAEQTTINPRLIHITPIASRAEEEEDFTWFQESVQLLVSPYDATTSAPAAATAPNLISKGPTSFDYSVKPKSTILKLIASYDIPEMAAWMRDENEALIYEVI